MLDLVAQNDAPDVLRLFFILKFRGVNADHHELICVLLFEFLQIGNDVDTVDAAVSPEVEQDYFAFKCFERERLVGIEPTAPTCDFGSAHASFFLYRHRNPISHQKQDQD